MWKHQKSEGKLELLQCAYECTRKCMWDEKYNEMHMGHRDRTNKKKDKVQNLCNEMCPPWRVCFPSCRVLSFSASALSPFSLKRVSPHEHGAGASHYRVFNLRAESDSRSRACGRDLHVALFQVQEPLLRLGEALAVVGRWALVRRSAANVVVIEGLVALVVRHRRRDRVAVERQVLGRFHHYPGLLLLHVGALALLEHGLHVAAVPVDHEQ